MDQQLPADNSRNGPSGGGGGEASGVVGGGQALTVAYLRQVEDMFRDQREKYEALLVVIEYFQTQRVDAAWAIARVKELFKGHNDIVFGFNVFLPKGSEITVIDDDEPPQTRKIGYEDAIGYLRKIERRFVNDPHIYKSFTDILNIYHKERKDADVVYQEVAALFEDHVDLLDDFTMFLPKETVARLMQESVEE